MKDRRNSSSSAVVRSAILVLGLAASVAAAFAPAETAAAAPARPIPALSRALIVSIDGLRPDALLRADAPVMHDLMRRGSFTMWARTVDLGVTLPSHVSMVTGVAPKKHGVTWNRDVPEPIYPKWPTLFQLARSAGLTTAAATGKAKFSGLTEPKSLDWSFIPAASVSTDVVVTDEAAKMIANSAPQVLFVHLPGVDSAGHSKGWGSPAQLTAIARADSCIGRLLDVLRSRGVLDSTVVLITSDHGGAGKSHGADDVRSLTIPWIVAGPGICADLDLATYSDLKIRTEDTFATVCWLLGLVVAKPVDGHPVSYIRCTEAPQ